MININNFNILKNYNEKNMIKNNISNNNKLKNNYFSSLNNSNNKITLNNIENFGSSNLFFHKNKNLKSIISLKINNSIINLNYSNEKLNIKNMKNFMTEINSIFLKKFLLKFNNYNNSLNNSENSNSFSNNSYKNINLYHSLFNLNNNNNFSHNIPIDVFFICDICNKCNIKNEIIFLPCEHKICKLCFKSYFENKIKKKEFIKSKCPFCFCNKEFSINILKENINIYLYSFFF